MEGKFRFRFPRFLFVLLVFLSPPPHASAQNGWTSAQPMTNGRQGMMTGVINGKIYAAGGYDSNYTTAVEVFDPAMNTWAPLAPMPAFKYGGVAGVINGKLYLAGGSDGIGPVATLFRYDPATNAWSTLASMPTARYFAAGGVIGGKLYVAGGTLTNTGASTEKFEAYDPDTNTWSTKAQMPPTGGRYGAAGAVLSNKLYVAGGYGDGVGFAKMLEVYDPITDSWTAKSPSPQIQHVAAAAALNGQLYLIAGQDGTNALRLVQVYEPVTDTWFFGPSTPTARYVLSAEVVNHAIYVIGGHNGTFPVTANEVFMDPSCSTAPSGVAGWWAGDGDARDNTGVNNGTLQNGATHALGLVGQSLAFDGSNDYVDVPDNDSLEGNSQFTVAAWILPNDVSNHRKVISKFGTAGNYGYEFGLGLNGTLRGDISGNGSVYDALISPPNLVTTGAWQHVAFTFNAGNMKIFLNGTEVASSTSTITSIFSSSTPLSIGRSSDGSGQFFSGKIDEAMVFNRALSAAEINEIFAPGKKGACKSATTSSGSNSQSIAGDQTITFQNVSATGTTTSQSIPPFSVGVLPLGYSHTGLAYDISTSATFTGPVGICFHLPSLIPSTSETNLRVLHLEGGTLVDRTVGREFSSSTLCSSVSSLSPFLIAAASAPTAATVNLSGQVTTVDGRPQAGVLLILNGAATAFAITDSHGNYRFSGLEAGAFYTVTPSLANHSFSPEQRSIVLAGNKNDALFIALLEAAQPANPLDSPEFFVRQHYLDFLGHEPDVAGLNYWANEIGSCNENEQCVRRRRTGVSAAFFVEQEFQLTGNFVYRIYKASLGRQPSYEEFTLDHSQVIGGASLSEQQKNLAEDWVARETFKQQYPDTMSPAEFVNRLFDTARLSLADVRAEQIEAMTNDGKSRAQVLRELVETPELRDREFNASFVLMQYFGYLQRNPDQDGFRFWLTVLNEPPGNYRGMVCAFITSAEYQRRFSPAVTRNNTECNQ